MITRTVRIDPAFSAALRTELVAQVSGTSARRRRRAWGVAGAVLGVGLAGGGIAIAADVLPLPGADAVTPRAASVTETHTGTATVDLGVPPDGVTHVDVELWCLTAGTFRFPDGASMTCSDADADATSGWAGHTLRVTPGNTSVTITADDAARWRLQATYVSRETTPWAVNENGDTYGVVNEQGEPDLLAVVATNGRTGYAYADELRGPQASSPDEAATWAPAPRTVDVYESDGETVIGEFVVGGS